MGETLSPPRGTRGTTVDCGSRGPFGPHRTVPVISRLPTQHQAPRPLNKCACFNQNLDILLVR